MVLAGARSAPAHPGAALSRRLVSCRAKHYGAPAGSSREGDIQAGARASLRFGEAGLGLDVVGGRGCGGSPGAQRRIRIPAAVTQCCGHSPADQDLGLGCGQQLWLPCTAAVPPGLTFFSSEPPGQQGSVTCWGFDQWGKAIAIFDAF